VALQFKYTARVYCQGVCVCVCVCVYSTLPRNTMSKYSGTEIYIYIYIYIYNIVIKKTEHYPKCN